MDQTTPSSEKTSKTSGSVYFLGIILAIIAAGLFYLIWIQKKAETQNSSTAVVGVQILQKQVDELRDLVRVQQVQLEHIQKQAQTADLSEIAYLVNQANLKLMVEKDSEVARQLLKMAMEKVALLNDPSLIELKKSLESDYARLIAMNTFKIEDVVLQLDNLDLQIQSASIMPNLEFKAAAKSTENSPELPWYKRALNSLSGLKNLFVIRRVNENVVPLIGPQEELYLKENIETKLMQAQWAAIHQRPLIYQAHLKLVENWLKKYFHNPKALVPILESLGKLQSINVKPEFPGLENTLKMINQLKEIPRTSLIPIKSPTVPPPLSPPAKNPGQKPEPVNSSPSTGVAI